MQNNVLFSNKSYNDPLHFISIHLLYLQLKAFYVDLLVPLETNLEKDTRVVQVILFVSLFFSFDYFSHNKIHDNEG